MPPGCRGIERIGKAKSRITVARYWSVPQQTYLATHLPQHLPWITEAKGDRFHPINKAHATEHLPGLVNRLRQRRFSWTVHSSSIDLVRVRNARTRYAASKVYANLVGI